MFYYMGNRDNKYGTNLHSCSTILSSPLFQFELVILSTDATTGFPNEYVLDETSGTTQVRLKTNEEHALDYILKISEEINEYRDQLTLSVYTHFDDHRYDVDFKSRQNITGTLTLLYLAPDNTQILWRDADNLDVVHTKDSFIALSNAIFFWTTDIYQKSWAKKEALKAMALEELQAYNVTLDW